MSIAAVSVVLDADLESLTTWRVLITLADYADPHGLHAFPTVWTLTHRTHLGRATVHRALADLADLGLIRRGDQAHVAHKPANRRPVVWDLDLARIRAAQGSHSETPGADGLGSHGVSQGSHDSVVRGLTGETHNQELEPREPTRARAARPPASVLLELDRTTGAAIAQCADCRQLLTLDPTGLVALHAAPAGGRCPGAGQPAAQVLRPPPGDYQAGAAQARAQLRPTDERPHP